MRSLIRWMVPTPHLSLRAVALIERPEASVRSILVNLSASSAGGPGSIPQARKCGPVMALGRFAHSGRLQDQCCGGRMAGALEKPDFKALQTRVAGDGS